MATKKRTGFGGSLLGSPQPLPDDDETPPTSEAPSTAPEAAREPLTIDLDAEAGKAARRPRTTAAKPPAKEPASKSAPSTLRLNEVAGPTLWSAYLDAKAADPFLSYRQFASNVVLAGLDKRSGS